MHICIVGCGKIAKKHARLLRGLQNYLPESPIILSFASRNAAKAEAYRKKFNGDFAFGSYTEAFGHPKIELVILCTPNDQHHPQALEALACGKDLVIEKPIACTTREADDILHRARERGRMVLVAENHRYRPSLQTLVKIIESGELGVLKFIRMSVMRTHRFRMEDWRANPKQMGGGPLIDGGIHWVNALLTLGGGQAQEVKALEPPVTSPCCPREDSINVLCRLANGAIGSLFYSWGVAGGPPLPFTAIHGSKGSAYVSNIGMFGFKMKGFLPRPFLLPLRDWKGYDGMWRDFLTCLASRDEARCLCTAAIGRRDLAFVEAAYANATPPKGLSKAG